MTLPALHKHTVTAAGLCALFVACGGQVNRENVPAESFCEGASARMEFNGATSSPATIGKGIALNCCEAGEVVATTATVAWQVAVTWRVLPSAKNPLPVDLDLANLPKEWTVLVYVGCDPGADCGSSPDRYTTGLRGNLHVERNAQGYESTICITGVEETSPHPILHSLKYYAPKVVSTF